MRMRWCALKIRYSRDALKFIDRQTKKSVRRIREAIAKLTKNPPEGDITTLHQLGRFNRDGKYSTEEFLKKLVKD